MQVQGLSGIVSISTGQNIGGYSLAVRSDGTAWAWGENEIGQLGIGTANYWILTPTQVRNPNDPTGYLQNVRLLKGGGDGFTVALLADGSVWSWGKDAYGYLGYGGFGYSYVPVQALDQTDTPLANVIQIAAGGDFVLALKSDGTVWSWGHGARGALGDGNWSDRNKAVAVQIAGVQSIMDAGPLAWHALAVVLP